MKMKKAKLLLLVLLVLAFISCGKKSKTENSGKEAGKAVQGKREKFLSDKEIKKIIETSDKDPAKINAYISIVNDLNEVALGVYSTAYKEGFTDGNDNFKTPQSDAIEKFVKIYEQYESKYIEFDGTLVEVEKMTEQKPELKKLDGYAKEFIVKMKAERTKMEEMYKYYKNEEYKKDNFAKGKELNDTYFKAIYSSGEKYVPFLISLQDILDTANK